MENNYNDEIFEFGVSSEEQQNNSFNEFNYNSLSGLGESDYENEDLFSIEPKEEPIIEQPTYEEPMVVNDGKIETEDIFLPIEQDPILVDDVSESPSEVPDENTEMIEYKEVEEPCVALTIIGENKLTDAEVFVRKGLRYSIKAFFSTLVLTIVNMFI